MTCRSADRRTFQPDSLTRRERPGRLRSQRVPKDSSPGGRTLLAPSGKLQPMPMIKQYQIVCLPPAQASVNALNGDRSRERSGPAEAELQQPTWGKGRTKAPFSTFEAGSNVSAKPSPVFLSFLGAPITRLKLHHLF